MKTTSLVPVHQAALQRVLSEQYEVLRRRNVRFSLRAFASRLQLSPGALSAIMRGKRRVSLRLANGIVARLDLDPGDRARLAAELVATPEAAKPDQQVDPRVLEIQEDQFRLIADGIHFSILSLLETHGAQSNAEWIALRLGASPVSVDKALVRLQRLGLLRKKGRRLLLTNGEVKTTDHVASRAIKRYHEDRLEEAKQKLYSVGVENRDFNAVTISVNRSQMTAAKKLIREFKEKLKNILQEGDRDEVYRFCIQLYPVTELKEETQNELSR